MVRNAALLLKASTCPRRCYRYPLHAKSGDFCLATFALAEYLDSSEKVFAMQTKHRAEAIEEIGSVVHRFVQIVNSLHPKSGHFC